ncbi:MAG TPA: DUF4844 domain-containing protein [Flavobacteriales bacterium]|nr:DUF4844 domain-containing protein [Flavobacteriales bacterium]HNU56715.1 DUF4844 domain-containing protein [Flavobacteriales bacterium]
MFDEFRRKDKFLPEPYPNGYPGISEERLKPILTERINQAADYFQEIASGPYPSDDKYLEALDRGLESFTEVYLELDTEDRERICTYFEELMDIVGLESSEGRLNNFMYGFDPS